MDENLLHLLSLQVIIEDIRSLQAKKSSSGQMLDFSKKSNTGENIFEIDYVIKWNLFKKNEHCFSV